MQRSPCGGPTRGAAALLVVSCAVLLAACTGAGSGDGAGQTAAAPAGSSGPAGSSSVSLAWEEASGPVKGYRVFVSREDGPFEAEAEVPDPQITLTGEPGERARTMVAALGANGYSGPASAPSPTFVFPDPAAAATAAGAESAGAPSEVAAGPAESGAEADPAEDPGDAPDLTGGLVWQSGGALRLTDAALETRLLFAPPGEGAELAGSGDFDGDGLSDLLWVDGSGALSFTTPRAALADGAAPTPAIALGALGTGDSVAAVGDFDADGLDDLLVAGAGDAIALWLSSRDTPLPLASAGPTRPAGVADFDGDGADDLVWAPGDGALAVWLMDAAGLRELVELAPVAGRELAAAGDFDGDGLAELAVRDLAAGAVSLLRPLSAPQAPEATDLAATLGWTSRGAVDLDRDGTQDLVLLAPDALHLAYLPGSRVEPLDPASTWELVALLP